MNLLLPARVFSYRIDQHDRIVSCNDDWFAFARENDGSHLTQATVCSRSIWGFISDPETRRLYQLILSRVRSGQTIAVRMRCDSPTARRAITLRMTPLPDGGVEFNSCIKHEEERSYVALLDTTRERSFDMVSICSWCKKVQVPGEGWFEVEEALTRLGLTSETHLPQLVNVVCYDCYRDIIHHLNTGEGHKRG